MELWEAKRTHGTASILDLWMVTEILGDDTDAGNKGSTCPIYLIYLSPILSIIYHLYFYFSPPSSQLAMTQFTKRKPVWNYKKRFWYSKSQSILSFLFLVKNSSRKKGSREGLWDENSFCSYQSIKYQTALLSLDMVLWSGVNCLCAMPIDIWSPQFPDRTLIGVAILKKSLWEWHPYMPCARENVLFVCKGRTAGELKISCLHLSKYCKGIPGNRERKTWGYQRLEPWFN